MRIVVVSSTVHQYGGFDVDDLHFRRRAYSASGAYHQSKLCNVLFAKELAKRYGLCLINSVMKCVKTAKQRGNAGGTYVCQLHSYIAIYSLYGISACHIYCIEDQPSDVDAGCMGVTSRCFL